ncbi:hypothetical protein [Halomonas alkaliantarctica]|uniref:hypothetical protein n=1 Tax=Halomonas alkaliantarctica TaxID=232346 RepID=UPI0004AAED77|nr:hypothetical protein [Halomonas alkaliantarctica]
MDVTTSIVASASKHYREGNYREALTFYQKAAATYGSALFKTNIMLCEQRLKTSSTKEPVLPGSPAESRQLSETQHLLEHYYQRCQELEYQLLENVAQ